jgi:hypothetical protein
MAYDFDYLSLYFHFPLLQESVSTTVPNTGNLLIPYARGCRLYRCYCSRLQLVVVASVVVAIVVVALIATGKLKLDYEYVYALVPRSRCCSLCWNTTLLPYLHTPYTIRNPLANREAPRSLGDPMEQEHRFGGAPAALEFSFVHHCWVEDRKPSR